MKIATLMLSLAMTGIAFAADAPKAPEPAKPVDAASFYTGRWYEIGRTPKSFSDGCVAGTTDFQSKDGGLYERDACHDKTPAGEEKVIGGKLQILNPGPNNKMKVAYRIMGGLISVNHENWVLDHGEDWAIFAAPDLKSVNLYTRDPHPAPALVERMTRQVKDAGYTGALEFPAQSAK
jgi:apolipoprotein D and lipocalin family protein